MKKLILLIIPILFLTSCSIIDDTKENKKIDTVEISVDVITLDVEYNSNYYSCSVKNSSDYSYIYIDITSNNGYVFSDDVNLVVNGEAIKRGYKIFENNTLLKYAMVDPNWSEPK